MNDRSKPAGVKRRDFLKVMGAGSAVAASVGCGIEDPGTLIPYLVSPDGAVPGVSNYYATTCRECSTGCGILAEVRDGRTIKLEGNPAHPVNRGALCARGQAAVQGLYNPDRIGSPMVRRNGELVATTWDEAMSLFAQRLNEARASGVAANAAFINQHESGAFPAFVDQWLADHGMQPHYSFDAVADTTVIRANREAYGVGWPGLRFDQARLIVSFGADFLDGWGASVPQQLAFADARARVENAPRFIYIGARRSLTGLNADEWIAARPGSEGAIARALLGAAGGAGGAGGASFEEAARSSGVAVATLQRIAREIAIARPSLILAGSASGGAPDLARDVAAMNHALGNVGFTIRTDEEVPGLDAVATFGEMAGLAQRMAGGQVPLLMVRGANPVYSLASTGFARAMSSVPFKVSFSSYPDETTLLCDLVLPDHHPLESWGLAVPAPGVIGMQQPTMEKVFDTRPTADILLAVARADAGLAARYQEPSFRDWVMNRLPGDMNAFTEALTRGLVRGTLPITAASGAPAAIVAPAEPSATPLQPVDPDGDSFYFVVYPSPVLGDGRGANKPWLQELPDPVSKICWQSWVEVHPLTAERLGIENGDVLRVETGTGGIEAPAWVYPGIRPDTIAMALGRGHEAYGRYASGTGVNPMRILSPAQDASGGFVWSSTTARVSKTGDHIPLVTIEGSARQHGRGVAQAVLVTELPAAGARPDTGEHDEHGEPGVNLPQSEESHALPGAPPSEFLPGLRAPVAADAQGAFVAENAKTKGMYAKDHWSNMASRRWAMTVDLARCTGCSACVTACYAENNIPTVGAEYQSRNTPGVPTMPGANILRSREMSWIRLERYFEGGENPVDAADAGTIGDFEARFVPMLCQHCGNAPCEPVCPVYATYHAPDGLNVQVYNRCVGTRYCSNNCPYKVRYFNWFGYGETDRPQYAWPSPLHWQLNPDVTVRQKGVMEKCTFCVQRIREAENRAALEDREVIADEFTTSCAQACPSRAITFGDAADPEWSVTRTIADRRAYHVFEELNTFTAVVYLKKVNHPAPGAPAAPGHA
ncbi:MAG: molybdopterin-dependent oxidoreductase [Gemmatimonadaceae bacterium]